jgi:hypothetical protein
MLRSVCKTPYRVLDAPELADDFYLNLVDWSSTNVLGVGLGACVYLWTAHNATVSKLCDLSSVNDTISSVSWVQKVSIHCVSDVPSNAFTRVQHWQSAPCQGNSESTTQILYLFNVPMNKPTTNESER